MASTFAWLDHSESQRRRLMELVATLQERDTVNELGVGSIRDALRRPRRVDDIELEDL